MTEHEPTPKPRFSRFDMAVAGLTLLLLAGVALAAFLSNPERKGARVAYLYPAYDGIQNIWVTAVDNPADQIQLTDSRGGIYNFSVSADGRYIAYAERDEATGLNDLKLLDLQTRQITAITSCVQEMADCRSPVFRPQGDVLAYERMNINQLADGSARPGAIRIWLADISKQPYLTRPLTDQSQIIGHSPQWAANGTTLTFYNADIANPGIMVYNIQPSAEGDQTLKFVPANNGIVGTISPNGRQLVFPDIAQRADGFISLLKLADMDTLQFLPLFEEDGTFEDSNAAWNPDGKRLAIERRYSDERQTRGYQIYLVDVATREVEPLVVDDRYTHGYFDWNSHGDKLVIQRFAITDIDGVSAGDARPEIWVRNITTGELMRVAQNAFHPRWVLP